MNYKYIEQLLGKYWDCETSAEEEQILRSFFGQEDIPEHLIQFAPLFRMQADESHITLGADFDSRMLQVVGEAGTDISKPSRTTIFRLVSRQVYPFVKAVAAVAVILPIGNVAEKVTVGQDNVDFQSTTEGAYVRQENISAQIKIIDQTRSGASIAKVDSLKDNVPSTPSGTENPVSTEVIR